MKDPAFLFYSSDFLSGVADLTMEERGQYITLLCLQHQKGHLSEKTIRLTLGYWPLDVIKKFSLDAEGNFFNQRLEEEIKKRENFIKSRVLNGKMGGRPNHKVNLMVNHKVIGSLSYGKPTHNLPENVNENENENVIDNKIIGEAEKKTMFEENKKNAFDEIWLDQLKTKFRGIEIEKELADFFFKCNSAPAEYHGRDRDGLRLGFLAHLKKTKPTFPQKTKNTNSAKTFDNVKFTEQW